MKVNFNAGYMSIELSDEDSFIGDKFVHIYDETDGVSLRAEKIDELIQALQDVKAHL